MALITPHLILRVAPGRKQQEEGVGSIRDEIRKRLALAEKGDLEQLLKGAIEDQEKKSRSREEETRVRVKRTKEKRQTTEGGAGSRQRTTADGGQTPQRLQTPPVNGIDG